MQIRTTRWLAILPLFVILSLMTTVRADSLDDFAKGEIAKRKIPGLSIAVLRDGKVVRASSYGFANLEMQTAASNETVYEIGSISKQFAAEAIMLLVEDGKLSVDDPIVKYLPANAPESWKPITVRNLLNHTSGLKDWTEVKEFSYRREYTPAEFIELVRSFPLQFQPGDNWLYSNTNLPLIGIIVEKASGRTFEDFVTERIIKPLNFSSIRFKHQEDIVANRATGYVLRDDALKNGEPFRPKVIAASGGILATATDLAKWWEAALNAHVMKQASLNEMLTPAKLNDGRTVAHGFAYFSDVFNGHRVIQHFGSTVGGFGSIVRYFPDEKVTVAVIGNLEDGGFGAEYIAKRVSGFYVPGASASTMKVVADMSPNQTANDLETMRGIAAGSVPASLSANFAAKVPDAFRKQLKENLGRMKSFAFLGKEKFTPNHFMLDATAAEVMHYRLVLPDKTVYYHIRINKEGKIGWITSEE